MTILHLTSPQLDFVRSFDCNADTPFDVYDRAINDVRNFPVSTKPKPKDLLKNATYGFERNEVVPLSTFSEKDLPMGWGIIPMYDSGNNHAIVNAGESALRAKWNNRYRKA